MLVVERELVLDLTLMALALGFALVLPFALGAAELTIPDEPTQATALAAYRLWGH